MLKKAFTYALPSLRLGSADFGQLGRAESVDAKQVMTGVVTGACGFLHSLLVTSDGTVWSFGKAAGGRLGNGDDITDCKAPHPSFKLNEGLPVKISAGSMHNCLITSSGDLLGWGYDSVRERIF